jgi:outer membrane protein insertion porin family
LKSSKYILFIALLGICIGCSLTKNLEEGQYAVYDNDIQGIRKSNKEDLYGLIEQEPNTRFLGGSLGVSIYRFGSTFYDSTKVATKRQRVSKKLAVIEATLDTLPDNKRLRKKEEKLDSKIVALDKKLEFGNALMRTGNPLVVLDSAETVTTVKNLSGYLVNHGFFDANVNFEVETKKKKAFITYKISEGSAYTLDSIYTRSDNPEIVKLLQGSEEKSFGNATGSKNC